MVHVLRREDIEDPKWRRRTRMGAAILLLGVSPLLAVTVWNWLTGAPRVSFALLFVVPAMFLGVAGLIHPPLLYVLGPRRPLLTKLERSFGTALILVGLALGAALTAAWLGLFA
jgi:hypothetical protein